MVKFLLPYKGLTLFVNQCIFLLCMVENTRLSCVENVFKTSNSKSRNLCMKPEMIFAQQIPISKLFMFIVTPRENHWLILLAQKHLPICIRHLLIWYFSYHFGFIAQFEYSKSSPGIKLNLLRLNEVKNNCYT